MEDQRLNIHAIGASKYHFHPNTNDTIKRESNAIIHYSIYSTTPLLHYLQYPVYLLLHSQLSLILLQDRVFYLGEKRVG